MLTVSKDMAKLGSYLRKLLDDFISDRQYLEVQWLKNLRQYQGTYDPEILARLDDDRSKVYPRDTRVKVKGGVAKMMEMMFPAQEKNYELALDAVPSIPKQDLEEIIAGLQSRVNEQGQPVPPTSEEIERAVREFASTRKDNMEKEIDDQLGDPGVDYPQLCKRVVRSGYIYGAGIARSPMVRTQKERVWELNEFGEYEAKVKTIRRPYPEYVRIWDGYPDLMAKAWHEQEMFFERIILTRADFRKLADRPDFEGEIIKEYLREHATGNYNPQTYETELDEIAKLKTASLSDRTKRRYEVYRALGNVSAHTLRMVGVEIDDDELHDDVFADLWFIDDVVIKAKKAAFGERVSDQYHAFIYAEDEDSGLTGIGLPEEVRDSQMGLCASTRALFDNMASTAGPIYEVNVDLLPQGSKSIGSIHAFKVIEREGDGAEANYPAVRDVKTESHIAEILQIVQMQREQHDMESNLPAYTFGNIQQNPLGEAFRTTNNMSMMMGSANMVTKDTVRAFDKFTEGVIGSLLKWNMEFNEKEELRGSYQVRAKGNISLVAREVRGAALDQFITTLTPEDRAMFDMYGINLDRLKARDLPTDRLLPEDEAKQRVQEMQAQQAQAQQIEQGLTQAKTQEATSKAEKLSVEAQVTAASADATIKEILSRIEQNLAFAESAAEKTQLENLKILLETAVKTPETAQ